MRGQRARTVSGQSQKGLACVGGTCDDRIVNMLSATATLTPTDRPIHAAALDRPVAGFGLADGSTLRSALAGPSSRGATLLVFLRHFG